MKHLDRKIFVGSKVQEKIFIFTVLFFPILQFIVMYLAVNFNSIVLAFQEYRGTELQFAGFDNFKRVFVSGMIMSLIFLKFTQGALPSLFRSMGIDFPVLLNNERTALGTIIFYMMWTGFASNLILYPNAMSAVSPEELESASIDGASEVQELLYILIPSIFPTITTFVVTNVATIFTASGPLYAFYNFNAPIYVRNTGYFLFVTTLSSDGASSYPYAAASGIVLTIISIPLTLFVRWIMEKVDPTEE